MHIGRAWGPTQYYYSIPSVLVLFLTFWRVILLKFIFTIWFVNFAYLCLFSLSGYYANTQNSSTRYYNCYPMQVQYQIQWWSPSLLQQGTVLTCSAIINDVRKPATQYRSCGPELGVCQSPNAQLTLGRITLDNTCVQLMEVLQLVWTLLFQVSVCLDRW